MISSDVSGEDRELLLLTLKQLRTMRIARVTPVEQSDGIMTFQVDFTPRRAERGKRVSSKVLLEATRKRMRLHDVRVCAVSGKG